MLLAVFQVFDGVRGAGVEAFKRLLNGFDAHSERVAIFFFVLICLVLMSLVFL